MNILCILELSVLVITLNLEIAILSLNFGTKIKRPLVLLIMSVVFAFFHCVFSLAGFVVGSAMSDLFGTVSRYLSSAVLIGVGIKILIASLNQNSLGLSEADIMLIFFGAGVEDFAGGVSVGTGAFGGNALFLTAAFFAISVPMNFIAFELGGALSKNVGIPADFVSGLMLISIGILSAFGLI